MLFNSPIVLCGLKHKHKISKLLNTFEDLVEYLIENFKIVKCFERYDINTCIEGGAKNNSLTVVLEGIRRKREESLLPVLIVAANNGNLDIVKHIFAAMHDNTTTSAVNPFSCVTLSLVSISAASRNKYNIVEWANKASEKGYA